MLAYNITYIELTGGNRMEKRKKKRHDPMLITFDNVPEEKKWSECIAALESDFKTSIKDVCCILKCSRSWVQKYIRPHVHYIYLSQRYVKLLNKSFKFQGTESVWMNTKELEQLIRENFTSCTRQTISIPIERLIEQDKIKYFQKEYSVWEEKIQDAPSFSLYEKGEKIVEKYLSEVGKILYNKADKYKRTNTKPIDVPLPKFDLVELDTIANRKEYGDTDEVMYRVLFVRGDYRLELNLPDCDGVISKKVYYLLPSKEEQKNLIGSLKPVTIQYEDYIKFLC